jgi:hypothetical protein
MQAKYYVRYPGLQANKWREEASRFAIDKKKKKKKKRT